MSTVRLPRAGRPPVVVDAGPRLLAHLGDGPGLVPHRRRYGDLPRRSLEELLALVAAVDVRGRGGAGFPLARKLEAVAASKRAGRGRPVVVVNLSEGEPASSKDAVQARTTPHLVLDGAAVVAHALGARVAHVVVPSEDPEVGAAVRRALVERGRRDGRLRWQVAEAEPRFVAGQARAVIELLSGRENLPVTSWQPEAHRGLRGRPTLLSNAETYAQVALLCTLGAASYARLGTADEPGTCLLTLDGDTPRPRVVEVAFGTPWRDVLPAGATAGPVLLGGYHGTWAAEGALDALTVSRNHLAGHGLTLGAGVVLSLADGDCPVETTTRVARYLAGQSAGRCGPCVNGLPALAATLEQVNRGSAATDRLRELAGLVTGRGACAHPDGTARLVRTLLEAYGDEVAAHAGSGCTFADRQRRAG